MIPRLFRPEASGLAIPGLAFGRGGLIFRRGFGEIAEFSSFEMGRPLWPLSAARGKTACGGAPVAVVREGAVCQVEELSESGSDRGHIGGAWPTRCVVLRSGKRRRHSVEIRRQAASTSQKGSPWNVATSQRRSLPVALLGFGCTASRLRDLHWIVPLPARLSHFGWLGAAANGRGMSGSRSCVPAETSPQGTWTEKQISDYGACPHPNRCRTGTGGVLLPENDSAGLDNGPGPRKGRPYGGDDRPQCRRNNRLSMI